MGITSYTEEVADIICERIALGESLRRICADDAAMPSQSTVYKWLKENVSFSEQYAHARTMQAETMVDEILEIADDTSHDTQHGPNGAQVNSEWISRSKLRVDARLKLMQQLAPKKYGPKMALTGADGGPLQVETTDARAALLSRLAGGKE